MAQCVQSCCYKGRGDLLIRKRADCCALPPEVPGPFRFMGNVSSFEWTAQTETSETTDYTLDRGMGCSLIEITGIDVSIDVECFSPANIALGMQSDGAAENVPAITVAATQAVPAEMVKIGSYIPIDRVGATAVTVTNVGGATVYALGVDYVLRGKNVIYIPPGSAIPPTTIIEIHYTAPSQTRVELLNAVAAEYELLLNGLNIAKPTDNEIVARLYRVRLAADSLNWLTGDGFGNFTLTGTALKDECATDVEFVSGLAPSKYGYIQQA